MKNILNLFIILTFWNCNSQSPIVDLNDWNGQTPANIYIKDVNNVLNPFEGTWLYTSGSTTLKIKLKKITMFYNTLYYEDLLIGEYQYVKNGDELFNSLSEIDVILPFQTNHNIAGNLLQTTPSPFKDYTTDNFRVRLYLKEDSLYGCAVDIRKTVSNGVEAIQILKRSRPPLMKNGQDYALAPMIPDGFYTLVKVP